jgi:hypothetical protein
MSDRLFSDCCYGTDWQHLPSELCPWLKHAANIRQEALLYAGDGQLREIAEYLRQHFVPLQPFGLESSS